MLVDRSSFLILACALAAGTAGCDRDPYGRAPAPAVVPPVPAVSAAPPSGPVMVEIVEPVAVGAAACDDSQGAAEECPSVGPSDEGVCPNVIQKRCNEFKAAMKPRVAAQAVACLRALKGNERCDPTRINQCGHAALMSACAEPARPKHGELRAATGSQPANVTTTPDTNSDTSPLTTSCTAISKACGERALSPTMADCRQTLAGMSETGRANMVDCVTQHCIDRGLHGCEASPKAVSVSAN